jgi:hypothetical protein
MADPNDAPTDDDAPAADNPLVDQQAALVEAVEEGDPDGSAASGA